MHAKTRLRNVATKQKENDKQERKDGPDARKRSGYNTTVERRKGGVTIVRLQHASAKYVHAHLLPEQTVRKRP